MAFTEAEASEYAHAELQQLLDRVGIEMWPADEIPDLLNVGSPIKEQRILRLQYLTMLVKVTDRPDPPVDGIRDVERLIREGFIEILATILVRFSNTTSLYDPRETEDDTVGAHTL